MTTATNGIETFDEFSFLPAQAAEFGIEPPIPAATRIALDLADGRRISALRYGDGAPVVTFLHGAGLNAHTWDTTILALGLPALSIDLPGHGDSSWRADVDYSAQTLAPDVVTAVSAWTDRPQVLVGQSLGGLTAAAIAASRPDLVRDLVVIDITPGLDPGAGSSQIREFFTGPTDWASRDELVERALAFGLGGSRAATERGVHLNSRVRADGRVEWRHHFAHLAAAAIPAPVEPSASSGAERASAAPTLGPEGWEDLAGVTAPVTLVRGDRGYVTADDAAEFQRRVPAASIVTVSAGHNVQEYIPVDLAALVADLAQPRPDGS